MEFPLTRNQRNRRPLAMLRQGSKNTKAPLVANVKATNALNSLLPSGPRNSSSDNPNAVDLSPAEQAVVMAGAVVSVQFTVNTSPFNKLFLADTKAALPMTTAHKFEQQKGLYKLEPEQKVTGLDMPRLNFAAAHSLTTPTIARVEMTGLAPIPANSSYHCEPSLPAIGITQGEASTAAVALDTCLRLLANSDEMDEALETGNPTVLLDRQPLYSLAGSEELPRAVVEYFTSAENALDIVARVATAYRTADPSALLGKYEELVAANPQIVEIVDATPPQTLSQETVDACQTNIDFDSMALPALLQRSERAKTELAEWARVMLMCCSLEAMAVHFELQSYVTVNSLPNALSSMQGVTTQQREEAEAFVSKFVNPGALPPKRGGVFDAENGAGDEAGNMYLPGYVPGLGREMGADVFYNVALGTSTPFCERTSDNMHPQAALHMLQDACKLYSTIACLETPVTAADAISAWNNTRSVITGCYDKLCDAAAGGGEHSYTVRQAQIDGPQPIPTKDFEAITGRPALYGSDYVLLAHVAALLFTTYSRTAKYFTDNTPVSAESGNLHGLLKQQAQQQPSVAGSQDFVFPDVVSAPTEYMSACTPDIAARSRLIGGSQGVGAIARDDCESLSGLVMKMHNQMAYFHKDGKTHVAYPKYGGSQNLDDGEKALDIMRGLAVMFPVCSSLTSVNGAQISDSQGGVTQSAGLHMVDLMVPVGLLGSCLMAGSHAPAVFKSPYAARVEDSYYSSTTNIVLKNKFERAIRLFEKQALQTNARALCPPKLLEATGPALGISHPYTLEEHLDRRGAKAIDQQMAEDDTTGAQLFKKLQERYKTDTLSPMPAISGALGQYSIVADSTYVDKEVMEFCRMHQTLGLPDPLTQGVEPSELYYAGSQALSRGADPQKTPRDVVAEFYCAGVGQHGRQLGWPSAVSTAGPRHKNAEDLELLPGQRTSFETWNAISQRKISAIPVTDVSHKERRFLTDVQNSSMYKLFQSVAVGPTGKLKSGCYRRVFTVNAQQTDARKLFLVKEELQMYLKEGITVYAPEIMDGATWDNNPSCMIVAIDTPRELAESQITLKKLFTTMQSIAAESRHGTFTVPTAQQRPIISTALKAANERNTGLPHERPVECEHTKKLYKMARERSAAPPSLANDGGASVPKRKSTLATVGSTIRQILMPETDAAVAVDAAPPAPPKPEAAAAAAAAAAAVAAPPPALEAEFQPAPEPEPEPEPLVATANADPPPLVSAVLPTNAAPRSEAEAKTSRPMGARHRVRALRKNLHEAEKAERQQPQKIKLQDTVGDTTIIDDETYFATTELIELVQLARDAGGQLTLADARHQLALSEIEVECMIDEAVLQTVHGTRTVTQDAFVKNNSNSIVLTSTTEQVLASQQGKVFVNL